MGASAQSLSATAAKDLGEGAMASGGLLLCSSPANEIAVGAPNAERTLFTGSLLGILRSGLRNPTPLISFNEARDATYQAMVEAFGPKAPYPVLHPFSQAHGDLAQYPAFPNPVKSRPAAGSGAKGSAPAAEVPEPPSMAQSGADAPADPRISRRLQRIGFWFSEEVIPVEDLDFVMSAALEERNDRAAMLIRRVLDSPKAQAGDVVSALAGIRDRTINVRRPGGAAEPPSEPSAHDQRLASPGKHAAPTNPIDPAPPPEVSDAPRRLELLLHNQAPPAGPFEDVPPPAVRRFGKYEIVRVIGIGSMGTVYEARDPNIDRRVAIKTVRILDQDDRDVQEGVLRFRREAQAAGRLNHPNVVAIFDYGESDDTAYIVMEFMEGPSLKQLLEADERFAVPEILRIMNDLLAALQYSHSQGVVHRDIKPGNVMLTSPDPQSRRFKIMDFGIARIESNSLTQAGTIIGTPSYMSPEQFTGDMVDQRSDIYSSGVLLYQLLTGMRPFEGSLATIMHKALTTAPRPPSAVSPLGSQAIDRVVLKAMARRAADRYRTAGEFAQDLNAAVAGLRPEASRTVAASPAYGFASRFSTEGRTGRVLLVGFAVLLLVIVAILALWGLRG
jgi:serine/threonine-protein kinase